MQLARVLNFFKSEWGPALWVGSLVFLFSWGLSLVTIELGHRFLPPGEPASGVSREADLFRFDSFYYRSIAEEGYSYDGHLDSSPNIVFAPLFPWAAEGLSWLLSCDVVTGGFMLNKVCFWLALILLFRVLATRVGGWSALLQLTVLSSAAGSYAFHAFYSESLMLFFFGALLWSLDGASDVGVAWASAGLGLTRLALAPVIGFLAASLALLAIRKKSARLFMLSMVCVSGLAGFLIFLGGRYGNPLVLLPSIQNVSWGRFHQVAPGWWWGEPLWNYASLARERSLGDIRTINLIWMVLALAGCVYTVVAFGRTRWVGVFVLYTLFIYSQIAGSEYLISAHRLLIFMLPIYLMFGALHARLASVSRALAWSVTGPLWLLNLASGLWVGAHFNQGDWFYF